jgi:hypothetical protein
LHCLNATAVLTLIIYGYAAATIIDGYQVAALFQRLTLPRYTFVAEAEAEAAALFYRIQLHRPLLPEFSINLRPHQNGSRVHRNPLQARLPRTTIRA